MQSFTDLCRAIHVEFTINTRTKHPLRVEEMGLREYLHTHVVLCYLQCPPILVIGASLSEPHIDECAVNFLYIYI